MDNLACSNTSDSWRCCDGKLHTVRCIILHRDELIKYVADQPSSTCGKALLELCSKFYQEIYNEKDQSKVSNLIASVLPGLNPTSPSLNYINANPIALKYYNCIMSEQIVHSPNLINKSKSSVKRKNQNKSKSMPKIKINLNQKSQSSVITKSKIITQNAKCPKLDNPIANENITKTEEIPNNIISNDSINPIIANANDDD